MNVNASDKQKFFDVGPIIQEAREKIAKILYGLAGVAEGERELALKNVLWELQQLQQKVQDQSLKWENNDRIYREESDLLRSLLGTNENELRARLLALSRDLNLSRRDTISAQDEIVALRRKVQDYADSDREQRETIKKLSEQVDSLKAQKDEDWQHQLSGFADEHAALEKKLGQFAERMEKLQDLLSNQAENLNQEKQHELAEQQNWLLREMREALAQREDLVWAEEELFARGVAQKLRGEIQAALGRIQLTLEKFHLLEDPAITGAKSWEQWWRLVKIGPEELRVGFQEVNRDLVQASETLEAYLGLTRRAALAKDDISLPDLIRTHVSELYSQRIEKGALEVLVDDGVPPVRGDRELFTDILGELLNNAFESLTQGGRVRVQLAKSADGKEAWLSVADTGPGLAADQKNHLFQPFYSTKMGHRGLGLARAKRYAEWHRGRLSMVETGPKGTTFRLSLPLAGGKP